MTRRSERLLRSARNDEQGGILHLVDNMVTVVGADLRVCPNATINDRGTSGEHKGSPLRRVVRPTFLSLEGRGLGEGEK